MREFELPLYGIINFDNQKELQVRFYKDSKENFRLELLNDFGDFGFGAYDLQAKFESNGFVNYITFINCYKINLKEKRQIRFDGFISYENFIDKNNELYINTSSLRNKISFTINNLERWIYPHMDICSELECELLDENGIKTKNKTKAKYFKMLTLNYQETFTFQYLGEQIKLSIINDFERLAIDFPKIELYPYLHLDLETEIEHNIDFYIDIILQLRNLFSLFLNQTGNISSIYELEYCSYRIDYYLINEKYNNTDLILQNYNIYFKDIRTNFNQILQKWFDIYDKYELIINSICNYEYPKYVSDAINKRAQLLETYGNIKTKGEKSRNDIITAIKEIKPSNLIDIFHLNKGEGDFLLFNFNLSELDSDFDKLVAKFGNQIMNIRNHFIHPYKNGSRKTPEDDNINNIFLFDNGKLKLKAVKILTNYLEKALIVLLLQELNIDQYYRNLKY